MNQYRIQTSKNASSAGRHPTAAQCGSFGFRPAGFRPASNDGRTCFHSQLTHLNHHVRTNKRNEYFYRHSHRFEIIIDNRLWRRVTKGFLLAAFTDSSCAALSYAEIIPLNNCYSFAKHIFYVHGNFSSIFCVD
jgi:hypothetical protein